jgi:glycosyltransferase involved in cell wall biosynthesis
MPKITAEKPNLAIVIPFYNEEKLIGKTLECIAAQTDKDNLSLIFINNNSDDKTEKLVTDFCKKNKLRFKILFEKKKGTVYSRKTGIEEAVNSSCEVVVSTDADTTFDNDLVEKVRKAFEENVTVGVLMGKKKSDPKVILWQKVVADELVKLSNKLRKLERKIFGPQLYGSFFSIRSSVYGKIPDNNPEKCVEYMGEDVFLARRAWFVGANFKKTDIAVKPSQRNFINQGKTMYERLSGNNVPDPEFDEDNLKFKKIEKVETKRIKDEMITFFTKRFIFSAADALYFWEKNGRKYDKALMAYEGLTGLVGGDKKQEINKHKKLDKIYNLMMDRYYEETLKKLNEL